MFKYVYKIKPYFGGVLIILIGILFAFLKISESNSSVNVSASVNPYCGDNILEFGEQCDGTDLGGQTCTSLGYGGGTLVCGASCIFDTSGCTPPPPPPPPPSGGGGGGGYYPTETKVIFSGRAYPKSTVTLLKDAQVIATTIAGDDSLFQISVSGLSGGNYIFSLYSEDKDGIRSSLLTFPVSITSGAVTTISGIFIAPTIAVDKEEVQRGSNIAIFGQSTQNATITIQVSSDNEFFVKTKSDNQGIYLYNFDTTDLEYGTHFTKSKAEKNNEISSFSKAVSFKVGTKNVLAQKPTKCGKADLNCEGKVNLVDFSIMAYWYKRPNPPPNVDLNGDGKINLIDFSIMAYYWTG